ncbi:MAG: PH domain-containing protein, partial [Polyangiales bacterium]
TKGTAMPGYCVGHFSYADLGAVWQATDCSGRALLVRGKTPTPLVLTPPDPEAFAASIAAGTETTITLAPPSSNPLAYAAAIALPVSLIVSTLVVSLLLLGPKRMRYAIEGGELHVRTVFGHKRWPIREVRARRYRPARMWRVAGSAAPGYFTGLYREHGQSLRVYATDTSRGVLIESPERVFINPEDEVGFFAALEKAGGTTLEGPP